MNIHRSDRSRYGCGAGMGDREEKWFVQRGSDFPIGFSFSQGDCLPVLLDVI